MASPSLSAARTVPAAVWFSAGVNVSDEVNAGAAFGATSLSTIVPVAVFSAILAFVALPRFTTKVSSRSTSSSSTTATSNCAVVTPGGNVTTPSVLPVKSASDAVPLVSTPQPTPTVLPLAADSDTVNSTAESLFASASAIYSNGLSSSSVIVPVAVVASAASVAFDDTPDSATVKVSSFSSRASSAVATVNVAVVSPLGTVTGPVVDSRSAAAAFSSSPSIVDAVQVAVTSAVAAADSVTVNSTGAPSVAAASATPSVGGSSLSVIVPVAVASPRVAFDGLDRVSVKVSSSGSSRVSSSVATATASTSVSSVAASVKVCAVSVAPKVTLSGTPDQSAPVSPGGVAPPAPAAETGTTTSRPGAASSCTVTSTVPPSSTEYDPAPNDTAAVSLSTIVSVACTASWAPCSVWISRNAEVGLISSTTVSSSSTTSSSWITTAWVHSAW